MTYYRGRRALLVLLEIDSNETGKCASKTRKRNLILRAIKITNSKCLHIRDLYRKSSSLPEFGLNMNSAIKFFNCTFYNV